MASSSFQSLAEAHVVGSSTKESVVRAEKCPALRERQMLHVGIADASAPYRMVRTHLNGAYMLACFSGSGKILLDGRWQICRRGMACLAPPHVLHAFRATPRVRWGFCWVKYSQPEEQRPIITASTPVMAPFNALALRAAILGLSIEAEGAADPALERHWVELIHAYVLRFAHPWHVDDRLSRLWESVAAGLSEPWSLAELSKLAHVSGEHLRRLCRRQLGRSPMHHVTYLRMQRAAQLLESTDSKIETIANSVGYENPFVFSTTFKKWIGWRPSDYRRWKREPKS